MRMQLKPTFNINIVVRTFFVLLFGAGFILMGLNLPTVKAFANTNHGVWITSPEANRGVLLNEEMVITAAGLSQNGVITRMDFFVDGVLVGSDTSHWNGYSTRVTFFVPGPKSLTVVGYDSLGTVGTSAAVPVYVIPERDNIQDLYFQTQSTGQMGVWYLNSSGGFNGNFKAFNPGFLNAGEKIRQTIDFNNDGISDLVVADDFGNGRTIIMDRRGRLISSRVYPFFGSDWKIVDKFDLNRDNVGDLVFHNKVSGDVGVWYMDIFGGFSGSAKLIASPGQGSRYGGLSDIDNSGSQDLIVQMSDGTPVIWFLDSLQNPISTRTYVNPSLQWEIKGTAKLSPFTSKGIVWENKTNGMVGYWYINPVSRELSSAQVILPGLGSSVKLIADVTGNGLDDILFQKNNGELSLMTTSFPTTAFQIVDLPNPGTDWKPVVFGFAN